MNEVYSPVSIFTKESFDGAETFVQDVLKQCHDVARTKGPGSSEKPNLELMQLNSQLVGVILFLKALGDNQAAEHIESLVKKSIYEGWDEFHKANPIPRVPRK